MPSIEQIDVDKVLAGIKQAAATAENEEELRIKASALLESEVISKLGIAPGGMSILLFLVGGLMDIATEYRKRVNDWLHILAPGEFPKKKLDYTMK